ncbi:MAG: hypothetical protein NVSMB26_26670 [Beijerinckiaceae bacterium]
MTHKPPAGLNAADYDAIEAAVMETARGRWFLSEFDRRRRAAETRHLIEAVERLEKAVGTDRALAFERHDKPLAIASPLRGSDTAAEAPAIAERLQDIAWHLRERGFDEAICVDIEEQARLVLALAERSEVFSDARGDAAPAPIAAVPAHDPRLAALARIDRMPLEEKLALFV